MAKNPIFPYPTLRDAVTFELRGVALDGEPAAGDAIRPRERFVYLHQHFRDEWAEARVEAVCCINPAELERFEAAHGPVELRLTAHCRPTNARETLRLTPSRREAGRFNGTLTLPRDGFRGRVNLRPIATATVAGVAHRTVAVGEEWAVYFDPAPSFRINETLPVRWANFKAEDAAAVARQFSDADHVADLDGPLPAVLLNADFEGLSAVLGDRAGRGAVERALHDGQRMSIARSVWMALVQDAAAAVRVPDEPDADPEPPEKEWQAEVLRRVLPMIDPSLSEAEALRRCATDWREHPGSAAFAARAEAAVGELIEANKTLRRTLRTLTRGGVLANDA